MFSQHQLLRSQAELLYLCGGEAGAGEGTLTGDQESLLSNLHKSQQQQQPTLQPVLLHYLLRFSTPKLS